jgi:alanine racemase
MLPSHESSTPIYPLRPPSSARAWLDVDLDAVRRNAEVLHRRAGVPLIAMVKADAYGLGMLPVARALGADFRDPAPGDEPSAFLWALGVATLDEAAALRKAGCRSRLFCSTPLTLRDLPDARALHVRPALHRAEDIVAWSALEGGPWHLSIDTGMSRAGVRWDDVEGLAMVVREHPPEGVFTHFHSAEEHNGSREQQDERFAAARRALGEAMPADVLVHSDNSAGIASRTRAHGDLARPGIGLYGSTVAETLALSPTVHLRARIIDLRDVGDGETVSYGATWRATGTRRIATISAGYADGYRRALSNRGEVIVRGQRVPVVGTVTMDMTMVDVTTLEAGCAVGDIATLIGGDGSSVLLIDDVAARAGLSPYELLVGLRLRSAHRYDEVVMRETPSSGAR